MLVGARSRENPDLERRRKNPRDLDIAARNTYNLKSAEVAELVDALDSGSSRSQSCAGSSPAFGIFLFYFTFSDEPINFVQLQIFTLKLITLNFIFYDKT